MLAEKLAEKEWITKDPKRVLDQNTPLKWHSKAHLWYGFEKENFKVLTA